MSVRLKTAAVVVSMICLVTVAYLALRPTGPPEHGEITAKVGVLPSAFYLPMFVASEKKFFAESGLKVELVMFNSVSDLMTAFLKGEVDVAGIGSAGAFPIDAANPGRFKFIYGQNNRSYSFMVRKDSTITSVDQLGSKRIGTWPSPTSKTFIRLVLERRGLHEGAYEIVPLELKSLNRALANRDVDALFNTDLFSQAGVEAGVSRYLSRTPLPDYLVDPTFNGGGVVRTEMISGDPQRVRRYIQAFDKAIRLIHDDPESARMVMLTVLPFEKPIVLDAPIDEFVPISEVGVEKAQQLSDMLYDAGLMKVKVDVVQMLFRADK